MDQCDAISRLTEREKEVLRAWLDRKTAKEIALDLGISHHAVEKRLKLARTKLGTASSLEAARLLADAEETAQRYQPTVASSTDLQSSARLRKTWRHPSTLTGVFAMLIATIFALTAIPAFQSAGTIEPDPETIEVAQNSPQIFDALDADRSGFLENPESPFVTVAYLDDSYPDDESLFVLDDGTDAEQLATFYDRADTDDDGRVSFREFHVWHAAQLAELGIEMRFVIEIQAAPES